MNDSIYKWQLKGLAKGADPLEVYEKLVELQDVYGSLSAEIVVREARNKKSVLHRIFEWDDTRAAEKYRLYQARLLLNNIKVNIVSDGETKEYSVFEITTQKDGYKRIQTFNPDDIEFIKASIVKSLTYWKEKLQTYKNFEQVLEHINNAIEALN